MCFRLVSVGLCIMSAFANAAEPMDVGGRVCLLLDDLFVTEQTGLKRTWHQGRPEPKPAITATEVYESWVHGFGGAVYDERAKLYRMYYESVLTPRRKPGTQSYTTYIHYAESLDGKTWTKPKLGIIEDTEAKDTNIVMEVAELPVIFFDAKEPDEKYRSKMFVYGGPGGGGTSIYRSSDGLHWDYVRSFEPPPYANPNERKYSDCNTISWDPKGQRYICEYRTFSKHEIAETRDGDGRRRAIGISFAANLDGPWSPIVTVLAADAIDDERAGVHSKDAEKPEWAEFYVMPLFNYGNHYLGMLSILEYVDGSDIGGNAGDLQFAYSHDALKWHRQPDRQTMIAPSDEKEMRPVYAMCTPPLEIDGRLWIYYTESTNAHPRLPEMRQRSTIRAATWRKDGFVSLDASDRATLTTHPLQFSGGQLRVNAKLAEGGSLRVGLLDESGQPIAGFAAADSDSITGDHTSAVVKWRGQSDVSAPLSKPVRVSFELSNGSLYSFRAAPPD